METKLKKKVVIFGAGITGLSAARELKKQGFEIEVFEAASHMGGLASTFRDNEGFIYDNGPRFIFSTLAKKIGIEAQCFPVKYYEHLHAQGRDYLFPFGFIKNIKFVLSAGFAILLRKFKPKPSNLNEFLNIYYGTYFSNHTVGPLIEKWCGQNLNDMSIDFASRLLPTDLSYIVYSFIKKLRGGKTEDYYKKGRYIVYPKGSNAVIFDTLSKDIKPFIHLNAKVEKLTVSRNQISSATINGQEVHADYFLSTMPITTLNACLPEPIKAWEPLKYRSIIILFIKLNKPKVLDGLWTWFPEKQYPFYRIAEYKNALPDLAPKDKTLISIEFACNQNDQLTQKNPQELFDLIQKDLKTLYNLDQNDVLGFDLKHSLHAYPILQKNSEEQQRNLTHQTPYENLFLAGRTGNFQYKMTEGCYDSAMDCAKLIYNLEQGNKLIQTQTIQRDVFGKPLFIHE